MSWVTLDFTHIQIVCDDASHTRGKVAKFDTFVRIGGVWTTQAEFEAASRHDYRRPDGSTRHNYTCDLCGLSFACTDATIARLLDLVAPQGVTQINLKALNMLASMA